MPSIKELSQVIQLLMNARFRTIHVFKSHLMNEMKVPYICTYIIKMLTVQLQYNLRTYTLVYLQLCNSTKKFVLKPQRSGFQSKLASVTLNKYLNLCEPIFSFVK